MTSSLPQVHRYSLEQASSDLKNHFKGVSPVPDEPRLGDICPKCKEAHLDYDSLLNLGCPKCGFAVVGSFT